MYQGPWIYACIVYCKQNLHIKDVYYSHGGYCSFHKHASYVCSQPIPHPHNCIPPHTPPWLTNVQFDAAYFMRLSPNTGSWLTWSLAGEVATLISPSSSFFFLSPPPPLFFFLLLPPSSPASTPSQSLLWRQQQSMHCTGGLKHCVWFPADKLTSGDLLTANSTEADTELGAWRGSQRGAEGVWGRFIREGEEGAQTERQTDGRKDGAREFQRDETGNR